MTRLNNDRTHEAEAPSTRWWESYLVRYFVGFIVGSICVAVFAYQIQFFDDLIKIIFKSQTDWTALIFVLSFMGIMYCYIASSPITVLHAGRYGRGFIDIHSRHFWIGWLITCPLYFLNIQKINSLSVSASLIILAVVSMIFISWLPVTKNYDGLSLPISWKKDHELRCWWKSRPTRLFILQSLLWACLVLSLFTLFIYCLENLLGHGKSLPVITKSLWLLSLPVFWIGFSQYFVLIRLLNQNKEFSDFYAKLFRARRQSNAKDVRDSYTHLREHSNSVFIVVVELAILALLTAFVNTARFFNLNNQLETLLIWILFALAFWMVPTVFMWGRANAMERDFAEDPKKFLS